MKLASIPTKQYIEQREEEYWIEGTRISLDSVVYSFLNGESPESIAQNFPLLSLEQVYGAIAFYLANRELVNAYLKKGEAEFQQLQQSCREKSPLLYQKLKAAQAYNMCLKKLYSPGRRL
ncbi:MAG: DUF433 domain-containing protein [Microcystis sp. M53603_WE2]|jgi:uncharacterized protein (DUF433 family)|uniref:DUF433 domain-containing protein n=1 Tax=unclassified Microcystis TaxID=2643300 RepID=UPI0022BF5B0A|nr:MULTISPECIES: DUF433 domain-containing protein [unclassified Microcystis]MCE2663477.1 DUF433 domain-containing protein [Microcystis sp. 53602_E8]MCZ8363402.1 DUF433 domain-containing protein [Microcystis sp. LE19-251.1A]MDJ0529431.1 DUF433 domain-containing protein [Microcystis sp. M53600_WE12]MDJ0544167.1 DUF433 domain-containing protein [Microcystis sp. M53601_WE4]MCZ8024166.1 DUF433 domain-containing protein [Microcystis sp. LE19-10.1B]